MLERVWRKGKLPTLLVEIQTGVATTENSMEAPVCSAMLRRVQLFATPWTVPVRLLCAWNSPGKNTGGGCHFLLQGIFPTQGLNPHLLHLPH